MNARHESYYEASIEGGWSLVRDMRDGEIVASFRHNAVSLPGAPAELSAQFVHARAVADAKARSEAACRERAILAAITSARVSDDDNLITVGPLMLDSRARLVSAPSGPVDFSPIEFSLLEALAENPTRVLTKAELLERIWGLPAHARTRTLDAHACRVRRKLVDATGERMVINVWGVGYRLVNESAAKEVNTAA